MQIEENDVLVFLKQIDQELEKPLNVTAVGGTAMTLLKLKSSTTDVDFELENKEDGKKFQIAAKAVGAGFKIDLCYNGLIFFQQLPDDYKQKRIPIKTGFKNIRLFSLHPLDIVATKLNRLIERDEEDIQACIKKWKITKKQVEERARQVEFVGNQENAQYHLELTLKKFFK